MNEPETAFDFAMKRQQNPGNNISYKKSPLGKNEVGKPLLKSCSKQAVRRTCISKLHNSDVPVIV